MREELKKFIKELYLKGNIDAQRYKKLNSVADDLRDVDNISDEYTLLNDYAVGDYPEFERFLTENRHRAAEDLESLFLEKIEKHLEKNELQKARLIMDMMKTVGS